MKMSLYKVSVTLRASLWLVPVLCVVLGAIVSFATIAVDRATDYKLVPSFLVGSPDAAMSILTTVAASMVSLTALVLTIVLVVVQLAMGQFSPRIVQRLLRDRPSQFAIGLFVATFVHTLLALREVDLGDAEDPGRVPGVAIVATFILALVCIAVLVMYVHHVGQALRVSALVELAGGDTRKLLEKIYPDKGPPTEDELDPRAITAKTSGVLTAIGHAQLVEAARASDCVLRLIPALGEYVPAGGVLLQISGNYQNLDQKRVNDAVVLSMERTLDQDVAYGLRLLVDMAERSLSDSRWQDPTTAVQAIDRLHDCLRQLARRPIPDGVYRDDHDEVRLVEQVMDWDGYVHLVFDEIRLAGAGSPQVSRRLQAALRDLLTVALPQRHTVLTEQLALLSKGSERLIDDDEDIWMAQQGDPGGLSNASTVIS